MNSWKAEFIMCLALCWVRPSFQPQTKRLGAKSDTNKSSDGKAPFEIFSVWERHPAAIGFASNFRKSRLEDGPTACLIDFSPIYNKA